MHACSKKFEQRRNSAISFSYVLAVLWNDLCDNSLAASVPKLKARLKTNLFNKYFQLIPNFVNPKTIEIIFQNKLHTTLGR